MSYKKIPIPQKTTQAEPADLNDDDDIDLDEAGDEAVKALSHPSYEALEAKLNEVEEQLNAANSALIEQKNQFLRHQAELENIRKRTEKDVQKAHQYGLERLINELLPVIDGMERGLEIDVGNNEFAHNMRQGLEMTLTLLLNTLAKFHVTVVNPLNQPFNPELHQAISTQEQAGVAPNTVLQVLQKGYLLHDRLIRPALVVVSK